MREEAVAVRDGLRGRRRERPRARRRSATPASRSRATRNGSARKCRAASRRSSAGRRCRPTPQGSGRLELARWLDRPGQSADRARHGQPHLAAPLRPGASCRRRTISASAAGRRRIRNCSTTWRRASSTERLVDQGDAPADHALADLPACQRRRRGQRAARRRATTTSGASAAAGSTPSRSATRCWPSAATSTARMGGPHPFPPSRRRGTSRSTTRSRPSTTTNRRSVYLMTQRIQRHPFLAPVRRRRHQRQHRRGASTSTTPLAGAVPDERPVRPRAGARSSPARLLAERPDDADAHRAGLSAAVRPAGDRPRSKPRRSEYLARVRDKLSGRRAGGRKHANAWESLVRALFLSNEFVLRGLSTGPCRCLPCRSNRTPATSPPTCIRSLVRRLACVAAGHPRASCWRPTTERQPTAADPLAPKNAALRRPRRSASSSCS